VCNWVFAEQLNKLTGVREFAGIETADVAIELQKLLCKNPNEQVCLLGVYADKTTLTGDGRTSGHGVYLELLNLHEDPRRSLNGAMLVVRSRSSRAVPRRSKLQDCACTIGASR
jgi:hypothetical protein